MESNAPPPPARDAIELACSMKEELLAEIEELGDRLPPNTLDQLIDELGGPENVAEVSALFYHLFVLLDALSQPEAIISLR